DFGNTTHAGTLFQFIIRKNALSFEGNGAFGGFGIYRALPLDANLTHIPPAPALPPRDLEPGDLLVTSGNEGRGLHYDISGNFLGVLWDSHANEGAFGLAYNADGDLFVGGAYTNLISRYNPVTRTFDPFLLGGAGGALSNPHQITSGGPDNDLYVAN